MATLPKAQVVAAATKALPAGMTMSPKFKSYLVECANEFVHLVTAESNELAAKDVAAGHASGQSSGGSSGASASAGGKRGKGKKRAVVTDPSTKTVRLRGKHIVASLRSLGFESYAGETEAAIRQFETSQKEKNSKKRKKKGPAIGDPEYEDLCREQERLFAIAAKRLKQHDGSAASSSR